MTDQLEDLFADLRAETLTRVRPPGSDRARRTVHRRRVVRSAATCVVAVAAVGAGAQVFGLPSSIRPAPPSDAKLERLQERATEALGAGPSGGADTVINYRGLAEHGTVVTRRLIAGTRYTVELACAGPGRVAIVLHLGAAPAVAATARCDTGGMVAQNFRVPAETTLSVELRPAHGAEGQAAVAAHLGLSRADQQQLTGAAKQRLPGPSGTQIGTSEAFLPLALADVDNMTDAGAYRYVFACAGAGSVTATVSVRNGGSLVSTGSATASCAAGSGSVQLPFVLHPGDSLESVFAPDAVAIGQAAYAAQLDGL